jgi:hypothetical protein
VQSFRRSERARFVGLIFETARSGVENRPNTIAKTMAVSGHLLKRSIKYLYKKRFLSTSVESAVFSYELLRDI